MDLIAKIPHSQLPAFIATIRYVTRASILRKWAQDQKLQRPIPLKDPDTGKILLRPDGEPYVYMKIDLPETFAVDAIADYVVSWEGLELDGQPVPYSKENLAILLDPRLDVEVEQDVEENGAKVKKQIPTSWSRVLADKAYERKTFDADPKTSGSAKP